MAQPLSEPRDSLNNQVTRRTAHEVVPDPSSPRSTHYTTFEVPPYQPNPGRGASYISPVQSITTIQHQETTPGSHRGQNRIPDTQRHVDSLRVNLPDAMTGNARETELLARQMREVFPGATIEIDHSGVSVSQRYDGSRPPTDSVTSPKKVTELLVRMEKADLIARDAAGTVAQALGERNPSFASRTPDKAPSITNELNDLRTRQGSSGLGEFDRAAYPSQTHPTVELAPEAQRRGSIIKGQELTHTPSGLRNALTETGVVGAHNPTELEGAVKQHGVQPVKEPAPHEHHGAGGGLGSFKQAGKANIAMTSMLAVTAGVVATAGAVMNNESARKALRHGAETTGREIAEGILPGVTEKDTCKSIGAKAGFLGGALGAAAGVAAATGGTILGAPATGGASVAASPYTVPAAGLMGGAIGQQAGALLGESACNLARAAYHAIRPENKAFIAHKPDHAPTTAHAPDASPKMAKAPVAQGRG